MQLRGADNKLLRLYTWDAYINETLLIAFIDNLIDLFIFYSFIYLTNK